VKIPSLFQSLLKTSNNKRDNPTSTDVSDKIDNENKSSSQIKNMMMDKYILTMLQDMQKKLPVVSDKYETWATFYQVYIETKKYFYEAANFLRIREAIQCSEIQLLGGRSLRSLKTCGMAIENVNSLLKRSSPVKKEYEELKSFVENHQMRNDSHLSTNIMKLLDFAIVATSHKNCCKL
jgi:hypothetical protein